MIANAMPSPAAEVTGFAAQPLLSRRLVDGSMNIGANLHHLAAAAAANAQVSSGVRRGIREIAVGSIVRAARR